MCKHERHLITSIMPADPVAHGGHRFVYGWYLRLATRAEILLRLMGRTEGLDCQHGVSTHFSFRVSEVPPVQPLQHPTSLLCHHLSALTESPGIWRREGECQLALARLTNRFLPQQRPWTTCSRFLSMPQRRSGRICFSSFRSSGVKMGHANVHECGAWMHDHAGDIYIFFYFYTTKAIAKG